MFTSDDPALAHLVQELENFQDITRYLIPQPGEVPRLPGIDVWGGTRPLTGAAGGEIALVQVESVGTMIAAGDLEIEAANLRT